MFIIHFILYTLPIITQLYRPNKCLIHTGLAALNPHVLIRLLIHVHILKVHQLIQNKCPESITLVVTGTALLLLLLIYGLEVFEDLLEILELGMDGLGFDARSLSEGYFGGFGIGVVGELGLILVEDVLIYVMLDF